MRINKKENGQESIFLHLDRKRYFLLLKDLEKLGKKYENGSSVKNLTYTFAIHGVKNPHMPTGGWSNRCEDFKFVIFLDFDNTLFWQVKTQLELLMEEFDLSPFYVFETESKIDANGEEYGGYNAVCLTRKTFREVIEIQNQTTCDIAHKMLPAYYRFHSSILRNKAKGKKGRPKFKCIIGDLNKEYDQSISTAHLEFLDELGENIPKIKYTNPDGYKTLWLSDYKTASK